MEAEKNVPLYESERIDDLLTHEMKIIQSHEVFCFSMDAVLLARFASVPKRGRVLDMCTGNGAIPLIMTTRSPEAVFEGIEIQPRLYDMASRNVQLNGLQERLTMHLGDVKEAVGLFGYGKFDLITCNPPYMPAASGEQNLSEHFAIARHEILLSLEDVIRVGSQLLKNGGKLALVHRSTRLIDIVTLMRTYHIEPKRMRLVYPRRDAEPNMVLIEGIRNGKPELRIQPPLIVYENGEEYCEELQEIYFGRRDSLA
ncbi:tRNA1(Val) (adenine(37)-N6)-methyltransferase [Brevibacillus composti]|uniref:tRNA1(Val) (Adenine(37)-N6)-methyltransferase n=1 Tax=Brevibacillus composti TaxID=2796470 RepID=A0A7T5EL32_9BACL|nr:tRNA1(Val) (adenine(37)-N6)-methyltransferase [Brevibacillus composti]QQE74540.1 tRNA1(Val) (adenine(37)-N6)-methyltransferase [Brevibacillus composti]QUO41622.1 tRNA1(Val) (adenine(37)-N6)-methyltransferase [Brevibacillus composti]